MRQEKLSALRSPGYESTVNLVETIVYLLCGTTMMTALVYNNLSMKLYTVTAILALFTLLARSHLTSFRQSPLWLPTAFLLIGLIDLIWYSTFKSSDSPFRATYHNYLNTAKVFSFGSIVILLAVTSRIRITKELILYILYSLAFIIMGATLYLKFGTNMTRIDFGIGTATGAAYSISFIGILSSSAILCTHQNHPILYVINVLATCVALIMTETRAAILVFPVISAFTLILFYCKNIKQFISILGAFLAVLIAVGFFFKTPLTARYDEAVRDITAYSNDNSRTSIGARLAMQHAGMATFLEHPLTGQSADSRAAEIKQLVTTDASLSGAIPYLNVHLHNEVIEAASLKGIAGTLSTLFLYFALFITAWRYRSFALFGFALALTGLGLSDVLIWARSIPIIFTMGLAVILLYGNRRKKEG
jgi:O-antigen ligase